MAFLDKNSFLANYADSFNFHVLFYLEEKKRRCPVGLTLLSNEPCRRTQRAHDEPCRFMVCPITMLGLIAESYSISRYLLSFKVLLKFLYYKRSGSWLWSAKHHLLVTKYGP
jgi:hypothetical protein